MKKQITSASSDTEVLSWRTLDTRLFYPRGMYPPHWALRYLCGLTNSDIARLGRIHKNTLSRKKLGPTAERACVEVLREISLALEQREYPKGDPMLVRFNQSRIKLFDTINGDRERSFREIRHTHKHPRVKITPATEDEE